MAQPTIDDYLASLTAPLGRALDRAQRVVEQELNSASQVGYYGNTIRHALDRLGRELDTGILVALARLKRARKSASLDHSKLWQVTVQELENFARKMKSIVDVEGLATLRLSQMTLVNRELAKFDEQISLALRHFQEALLEDGAAP